MKTIMLHCALKRAPSAEAENVDAGATLQGLNSSPAWRVILDVLCYLPETQLLLLQHEGDSSSDGLTDKDVVNII